MKRSDKQLLDGLQTLTKGHGKGWILRDSGTRSGMHLHETSQEGTSISVRKAINIYLDERLNIASL